MSKKVFTLLLLAVFVLAQFSAVAAAPQPAAVATATVPTVTNDSFAYVSDTNVSIAWSYNDSAAVPAATTQYVLLYTRLGAGAFTIANTAVNTCRIIASFPAVTAAAQRSGTFNIPVASMSTVPPAAAGVYGIAIGIEQDASAAVTACTGFAAFSAVPAANQSSVSFLTKLTTYAVSLAAQPTFSQGTTATLAWSVTSPAALLAANTVYAWARTLRTAANGTVTTSAWACRMVTALAIGSTSTSSTYAFAYASATPFNNLAVADQDTVEFAITVEAAPAPAVAATACTTRALTPPAPSVKSASTFIDTMAPIFDTFLPPNKTAVVAPLAPNTQPVACNTWEYWGLGADVYGAAPLYGYSGLKSWNWVATGSSAAPAPTGTAGIVFSMSPSFPASAFGPYVFSVQPKDAAGNGAALATQLRSATLLNPTAAELAACKSFSDVTATTPNAVQIRYVATLGIVSGDAAPATTFRPAGTLSRAEAAVLLVNANGSTPITTAPLGCTFSDVLATDWFAKYVWTACSLKFMVGDAAPATTFSPYATFTRGQAATILEQLANGTATGSGFFAKKTTDNTYWTVLNKYWGRVALDEANPYVAFTDVAPGAYYAAGANNASAWDVISATAITGTDANGNNVGTFSPDTGITRGDFAKALYRALSRLN